MDRVLPSQDHVHLSEAQIMILFSENIHHDRFQRAKDDKNEDRSHIIINKII
jgi:hypothetical protein